MKLLIPIFLSVIGLCALYPLQNHIDKVAPHEVISDESLYFASGKTIKKLSVGLDGLVADIYWIRTVQYFGRKVEDSGRQTADVRGLRLDLLAPLLNIIVELDPHDLPAYRFGGIFLPDIDTKAAVDLLERGIRDNPDKWRLYQDLGFILWHSGDYAKAAEIYEKGSQIPDAAWWMRDLAGLMQVKGGSRAAAKAIYQGYLDSDDQNIRDQALKRLEMLQALDELDALNSVLAQYKSRFGACPPDLRPFGRWFQSQGSQISSDLEPLDPAGYPYRLDAKECKAEMDAGSWISRLAR